MATGGSDGDRLRRPPGVPRARTVERVRGAADQAAARDTALPSRAVRKAGTRSRQASRSGDRTVPFVVAGVAGAAGLLVAGMLLAGALRPGGIGSAAARTAPSSTGGGAAGATPGGAPTGKAAPALGVATGIGAASATAAARAQVLADASTAQSQAAQATAAARQAAGLLQSAQAASAQVTRLAAPALARSAAATSPSTALQPLAADEPELMALVAQAQQAAAAASAAARDAAAAAQADPGADGAVSGAQAAASRAQAAVQQAQAAGVQVGTLVTQAESQVEAWASVHAAAPGYFGATVEDPPASFGVQGCEVDAAAPGSPAAAVGLVGRTQRTDPVGDVITSVTDATDAGAVWPVADCTAFGAAMQQTRAGDQVTVAYYHRRVIWYELSGRWVMESGTATLTAAPGSNCPAPIGGTISPALTGNRINLTIALLGPSGTRAGLGVMLDTGGVESYFPDALLRGLGYSPFLATVAGGIVPGATGAANLYRIPGAALTALDGGRYVPLATGTLTVMGVVGGTLSALGPDILKQGARLTTAGDRWTLTPPCQAG